jgi:hypothetical protein
MYAIPNITAASNGNCKELSINSYCQTSNGFKENIAVLIYHTECKTREGDL